MTSALREAEINFWKFPKISSSHIMTRAILIFKEINLIDLNAVYYLLKH